MKNTTELYGTLLEKQDEISTMTKRMNKLLEKKAKIQKELDWFREYGYYIGRVYNNIDGEACGYADGDEEYAENFKQNADQL
tara:strand:+ start:90 stop:335 length:246 start_codon:yes stop_codon:yes gene_type:complete